MSGRSVKPFGGFLRSRSTMNNEKKILLTFGVVCLGLIGLMALWKLQQTQDELETLKLEIARDRRISNDR